MKTGKIIVMLLLIFAIGCAKDKGNYKYETLPRVEVIGVSDQTMVSMDTLKIRPFINVYLGNELLDQILPPGEDADLNSDDYKLNSNLSFVWEIGGEKISEEIYLNSIIEGYGAKYGRYIVTNNDTGLSYFFPFTIRLASPFSTGYFALAADNDNKTILTFKSTLEKDKGKPIISVDNVDGREFGYNPVNLGNMPYRIGANIYTNYDLYISSKDSEDRVVVTDLINFNYKGSINEKSIIGELLPGQSFIAQLNNDYFYIIDGRLHTLNKKMIYRASAPTKDYYLAPWIGSGGNLQKSAVIGYDEKNDVFLHFVKDIPNPETGYTPDKFAFDLATPIPVSVDGVEVWDYAKGHRFVAGSYYGGYNSVNQKAITSDNHKLYFYSINMPVGTNSTFPTLSKSEGILEIPGTNENTCALLNTSSYMWYIAAGNTIYTCNYEMVKEYESLVSLPENSGDIVQMIMIKKSFIEIVKDPITGEDKEVSKSKDCMLIATYNPSSTEENKGSLYIVNLVDRELVESYPNCTGKTVTLFESKI